MPSRVTQTKRSWISLLLAISAVGMVVTGILSFSLPYSQILSGMHTWLSLTFISVLVFHLSNNLKALAGYVRSKLARVQLVSGGLIVVLITLGVGFSMPPFESLLDFGYKLRKTAELENNRFSTINTQVSKEGVPLIVSLRAGAHYQSPPQPLFLGLTYRSTPQMAFWVEDTDGNYIETLYVTGKISESRFRTSDLSDNELKRRPEALPYWSHKRGVKEADGLLTPQYNTSDLDGVTGATPLGHYDLDTLVSESRDQFNLMMEINRSYDFNEFYSPDRFPDDPIYSGSGASGQPSIIYSARLDTRKTGPQLLRPIGHGHHSGQDGKLYKNMSGIDTALELVDYVVAILVPDK